MHRNAFFSSSLLCLATFMPVLAGPDDTVWTPLFNGADMKDWDIKVMGYPLNVDSKNTWRVTNGAIEVNYSNLTDWTGEPWSHAEYKVRPYSHYLLRVEYQFYGTQVPGAPAYANENSGIMLHSQKLSTMAVNQNWPISLENQLLGPKSGEGTGSSNLCTPGTAVHNANGTLNNDHCIRAAANTRTVAPLWTLSTSLVLGDSVIKQYIEGKLVLTYYKPVQYEGVVSNNTVKIVNNTPLTSGYIQLQSESAPIRFRKVELANLEGCKTPASPNYKSYYIKHDPAACNAVSIGPDRKPPTGSLEFHSGEGALVADFAGDYGLEIRDLAGERVWSGKGRGRQAFALGSIGRPGLYFVILRQAGQVPMRKAVCLP
ncbi:MAG: hypothetical protein JWP91_309 [Fibrobacteres bacterium]|nr:hypothetical protein [Fibrobacterota bacterium]